MVKASAGINGQPAEAIGKRIENLGQPFPVDGRLPEIKLQ
jgi:hypothetical protein